MLVLSTPPPQTHWTLNVDYTSTVLDVLGKICNRIGAQPETLVMYERDGSDPQSAGASPAERRLQYTGTLLNASVTACVVPCVCLCRCVSCVSADVHTERLLPICQEWTKANAKKHFCVGKLPAGEVATMPPSPRGKENGGLSPRARIPVR